MLDDEGNESKKTTRYDTTVGRALLLELLPQGLPFSMINQAMTKKVISNIIE